MELIDASTLVQNVENKGWSEECQKLDNKEEIKKSNDQVESHDLETRTEQDIEEDNEYQWITFYYYEEE